MEQLNSTVAAKAAGKRCSALSDQMNRRRRTSGVANPQPPFRSGRLNAGRAGGAMPGRLMGRVDRAGRRQGRPDEGTNLTGLMMEIVRVGRAFVTVAMMVRRPGGVGRLGHGMREMLRVGGGVDCGQWLVEQHRNKSE